ncbi:alpha/beta fold hydrolase [Xanthobacter sp. V4C-4]|uniref:alpha/beta hydrolase n=1 Tax=Xanthobacter cornucopiae TaxID=3119924 RepID=UPI00372B6BBA
MSAITEGPGIAALSCGKPVYLVVLLHGEGADGRSIIDQALNWAPALPKADFLAAEAPWPAPGGGRSWFDADPARGPASIMAAASALNTFLDAALAARRLPDSHLALVGFSQGATLALCAALRRSRPVAAVVGFAGALPEAEPERVAPAVPVLLIHGEDDPVVPFAAMTAAKERLKAAGVPAKSVRRPGLGHAMDDDGIGAAGAFLTLHLAPRPAATATGTHRHDQI